MNDQSNIPPVPPRKILQAASSRAIGVRSRSHHGCHRHRTWRPWAAKSSGVDGVGAGGGGGPGARGLRRSRCKSQTRGDLGPRQDRRRMTTTARVTQRDKRREIRISPAHRSISSSSGNSVSAVRKGFGGHAHAASPPGHHRRRIGLLHLAGRLCRDQQSRGRPCQVGAGDGR